MPLLDYPGLGPKPPPYLRADQPTGAPAQECARWREEDEHEKYNAGLVRTALKRLRAARAAGSPAELLEALGTCVRKSFAGIDHEALYSKCHAGTKQLIEAYLDEVEMSIAYLRQ